MILRNTIGEFQGIAAFQPVVSGEYSISNLFVNNDIPGETFRMMTSSNGNFSRVNGPLCGEFTGSGEFPAQRPVTRSFDVFFDLRLNKRLSKQPWGWWFETPSWSLWRQCNGIADPLYDKATGLTLSHYLNHRWIIANCREIWIKVQTFAFKKFIWMCSFFSFGKIFVLVPCGYVFCGSRYLNFDTFEATLYI